MSNRLFVGNLDFNTMDQQLRDGFTDFGTVVSAVVFRKRLSRFGYVEHDCPGAAHRAIESMNGATLQGRTLNVSFARERAARSSGRAGC